MRPVGNPGPWFAPRLLGSFESGHGGGQSVPRPARTREFPSKEGLANAVGDEGRMAKRLSKNIVKARAAVTKPAYALPDAVGLLKQVKYAKFDETVDLTMRLGVDTRHADQMVRGTVVLPHGLGKTKTVAVIATGDRQKEATAAGADFVGGEEMVEKIQKENWTAFDALIATPDMMKVVGRLGKVLGPKGLMPNPKTGTVTLDVAAAVKEIKAGKVEFRADKTSLVHVPVGKLSFDPQKLVDNATTVIGVDCARQAFSGQGQVHQERHAELDDGARRPAGFGCGRRGGQALSRRSVVRDQRSVDFELAYVLTGSEEI